jgi:hypothetical protein
LVVYAADVGDDELERAVVAEVLHLGDGDPSLG